MTHELTDEEIMERVDFLANGHRLDYDELIEFARSIETAVLAHLAQRGTSVQPPEFQEVSWGVTSTMRPVNGMAVSEYAFRQWAKDVGIVLAASPQAVQPMPDGGKEPDDAQRS